MGNGDKPLLGGGLSPRPEAEEEPFDKWLRKQLHAMFDGVVSEPLPADLLKAIDEDAERARQEASAGRNGVSAAKSAVTKRSS